MSVVSSLVFFVLSFLILFAHAENCTNDNIGNSFTPCGSDGQRQRIQYWSTKCTMGPNSPQLDPPQVVPCIVPCPSGTFYSPKTLSCAACAAGSYSFATGDLYLRFNTGLPDNFATYCSPDPCQNWAAGPGGAYLDSGNQSLSRGKDAKMQDASVEVSLVLPVNIINRAGGSLSFSYRVESEEYFDGLQLTLNGTTYVTGKAGVDRSSWISSGVHQQWRSITVALPYGKTEVRWIYTKDADDESAPGRLGVGTDRAYLREIKVDGTKQTAEQCYLCPDGHYSFAGAKSCLTCPANYSSNAGDATCQPCGSNQWSPPGSALCLTLQPCNPDADYSPVYGTCSGGLQTNDPGTRLKTWVQSNPHCISTPSTMPQTESVPCASCMPGMFSQNGNPDPKLCIACQDGYALINGQCQLCPGGTAAIKKTQYDTFDQLNSDISTGGFSTNCRGICRGCNTTCDTAQGWDIRTFRIPKPNDPLKGKQDVTVLHSGFGHGYHATVVLQKTVTLYGLHRRCGGRIFDGPCQGPARHVVR